VGHSPFWFSFFHHLQRFNDAASALYFFFAVWSLSCESGDIPRIKQSLIAKNHDEKEPADRRKECPFPPCRFGFTDAAAQLMPHICASHGPILREAQALQIGDVSTHPF